MTQLIIRDLSPVLSGSIASGLINEQTDSVPIFGVSVAKLSHFLGHLLLENVIWCVCFF